MTEPSLGVLGLLTDRYMSLQQGEGGIIPAYTQPSNLRPHI